jgi:hypothetical protein
MSKVNDALEHLRFGASSKTSKTLRALLVLRARCPRPNSKIKAKLLLRSLYCEMIKHLCGLLDRIIG